MDEDRIRPSCGDQVPCMDVSYAFAQMLADLVAVPRMLRSKLRVAALCRGWRTCYGVQSVTRWERGRRSAACVPPDAVVGT
jgi:hypothetical protein